MAEKIILEDVTKCMGCRGCQVACKQWNELEAEETINTGSYENPPDLSPQTWVKVKFTEVVRGGKVRWLFTLIKISRQIRFWKMTKATFNRFRIILGMLAFRT